MLLRVFGDYCLRSAVLGGARIRPAHAADSHWAFLRWGRNIVRARTERNLSKIAHTSRPHRRANSATISDAATAEKPWLAARRALAWRVNKPENDDASIIEPIELATNTA